jgi:hypothetical protein
MHSGNESEDSSMEPEEFSDPITLSLMVPFILFL